MTPEEFRRHGYAVVDWIADYLSRVEEFPVLSRVAPGDIRAHLPASPPADGEPFEAILADVDRILLPGITHWQSPNFFAYFPANSSPPAILGELLSAGLGVQGMLWMTSPSCTELETHVLDWLVDMLALPAGFRSTTAGGGVIQDTASSAVLCALVTARERVARREGSAIERMAVYASSQAHSSVEKAVRIAGLDRESLRLVEVDATFAMRSDRLAEVMAADRAAGRIPAFVCATIGTTSSLALDPVAAIGPICRAHGAWLHVDAAMAGTAALCPEFRFVHDGLEWADSYCFNPHKWMFTNFDCSAFWVADRAALIEAMSILPEYLRNQATATGAVIDYRDWHVPLGRRFRALKLWFVIRSYGVRGLQKRVRLHVALAQELARRVEDHPEFELAAPPTLNLVCFRHRGGDERNRHIMDRVNASGRLFLTHTKLDGRITLRMAVGQTGTERRHVEAAWQQICDAGTVDQGPPASGSPSGNG